jgi:hypothetical protein
VHGGQAFFETKPGPAQTPAEVADAPYRVSAGEAFVAACCEGADNPVAMPTAVVRNDLPQQVGGYTSSLPHTADLELWLRFAARASVARVEAHRAYKRMPQSNMQHQYVRAALRDLRARQGAFDSFFRQEGDRLADAQGLRRLATRGVAGQAFWAAGVRRRRRGRLPAAARRRLTAPPRAGLRPGVVPPPLEAPPRPPGLASAAPGGRTAAGREGRPHPRQVMPPKYLVRATHYS